MKTPRMRAWISEWVGAELGEAFRRGYKDSYRSEARVRVENPRGSGIGGRKNYSESLRQGEGLRYGWGLNWAVVGRSQRPRK